MGSEAQQVFGVCSAHCYFEQVYRVEDANDFWNFNFLVRLANPIGLVDIRVQKYFEFVFSDNIVESLPADVCDCVSVRDDVDYAAEYSTFCDLRLDCSLS